LAGTRAAPSEATPRHATPAASRPTVRPFCRAIKSNCAQLFRRDVAALRSGRSGCARRQSIELTFVSSTVLIQVDSDEKRMALFETTKRSFHDDITD
jgi:hypothetical protein